MQIYNILFFHIYQLALHSKSNRDMPMFITVSVVSLCFIFNVGSLIFILQGSQIITGMNLFPKSGKILISLLFLGWIAGFYLYKNRYKVIYETCKLKYSKPFSVWRSLLIVIAYYFVSFGILLLTGLYKNHDWIFRD